MKNGLATRDYILRQHQLKNLQTSVNIWQDGYDEIFY